MVDNPVDSLDFAIAELLDLHGTLHVKDPLRLAIEIAITKALEGTELARKAALADELTRKAALADELTRMHAELSVTHGNVEAKFNEQAATFKKGILEIAEIVWDTSAKSADRIRRLQEQCVPREYLDALRGDS